MSVLKEAESGFLHCAEGRSGFFRRKGELNDTA